MAMASPCNGDGTMPWKSFHGVRYLPRHPDRGRPMASDDNPPGAPTRRAVIGGLAALTGGLAGATLGPRRGAAATVSAPVRVGDIELMVVSDGTLAAPRAFALPQTPPRRARSAARPPGRGPPRARGGRRPRVLGGRGRPGAPPRPPPL